MKHKRIWLVALIGLLAVILVPSGFATVVSEIQKTLKLDTGQRDLTVSENGKWIFILTDAGEILVYSSAGQLKGKIPVGKNVTQIKAGPSQELLLLSSPADQTVQVLSFEFIQEINTKSSPVRGDTAAPVSIVLFAEFQ